MEENLIALLQMIEEFQTEYDVRFDIWATEGNEVQALDSNWTVIGSVERS